jgi:hypothetical protein
MSLFNLSVCAVSTLPPAAVLVDRGAGGESAGTPPSSRQPALATRKRLAKAILIVTTVVVIRCLHDTSRATLKAIKYVVGTHRRLISFQLQSGGQFRIVKLRLGLGTFGRVLETLDLHVPIGDLYRELFNILGSLVHVGTLRSAVLMSVIILPRGDGREDLSLELWFVADEVVVDKEHRAQSLAA